MVAFPKKPQRNFEDRLSFFLHVLKWPVPTAPKAILLKRIRLLLKGLLFHLQAVKVRSLVHLRPVPTNKSLPYFCLLKNHFAVTCTQWRNTMANPTSTSNSRTAESPEPKQITGKWRVELPPGRLIPHHYTCSHCPKSTVLIILKHNKKIWECNLI